MRQRGADREPGATQPAQRIFVAGVARGGERCEAHARAHDLAGQPRVEVARLRAEHADARNAGASYALELEPTRCERRRAPRHHPFEDDLARLTHRCGARLGEPRRLCVQPDCERERCRRRGTPTPCERKADDPR